MGETAGPCVPQKGKGKEGEPDPPPLPANYKLVWKLLAARCVYNRPQQTAAPVPPPAPGIPFVPHHCAPGRLSQFPVSWLTHRVHQLDKHTPCISHRPCKSGNVRCAFWGMPALVTCAANSE
eukprot:scaffold62474_cov24-Tisochrysis_lutea.AAC.1